MAGITISSLMCSHEWKTAFLVNFSYVRNHPVGRGVATLAIGPYRLVMHISMTINTIFPGFFECQ
jgi:hypothetical protein